MRFLSPLALTFLLLGSRLYVRAQESAVVRVGVVALGSFLETVQPPQAQDRLVKEINQSKPDKKLRFSVKAVALESAFGGKALAEAREKNCDFVLLTHLVQWDTSSKLNQDSSLIGLNPVQVFAVTVDYELRRAADGVVFAIGVAKEQDKTSLREVMEQTIAQVAGKVIADIRHGGMGPRGDDSAPENQAGNLPLRTDVTISGLDFCDWLPVGIPHSSALQGVCQYAIHLPERMPNFICNQVVSRYSGNNPVPADLITASVRYEDGNDSYSDVRVNGHRTPIDLEHAPGLWSSGEFSSNNLRSVFDPRNQPSFEFTRESTLGDHAAWIFSYRIAKQNDPLWGLRAEDQMLAPPYRGEVWVDQKSGDVLRFESVAADLPKTFPMTAAGQQIDYERVAFEDGSAFVLPSDFTVSTTYRGQEPTRNVVQLRNYHKFRAKARLIFGSPASASPEGAVSAVGDGAASLETELEENNQILAILREQTLQEDAERLEDEQRQELEAVTVGALRKLDSLRQEQQKILASQEIARNTPPPAATNPNTDKDTIPSTNNDTLPRFKASARLVQVSVVLRDSNGRAVGSLRQEDFRLFDDRKPQVITSFFLEQSAASQQEQAPTPIVETPSVEIKKTPNQAAAVTGNRSPAASAERDVAYIFDDVHGALEDLANAKAAASRHIAELRAEDRAAIISASAEVQMDFTGDREKLLDAVRRLKAHPLAPVSDCPPITYYMADRIINQSDVSVTAQAIDDTIACASVSRQIAEGMAAAKAAEVLHAGDRESQQALQVLRDVIRRTATMPGQRSIVLVSPGFLAVEAGMQQELAELIDQAIRSDIVVSAIDSRGLYTVGVDAGSNVAPSRQKLLIEESGKRLQGDVMAELASGTGGIFIRNNNNLDEGFRRTADAPEYIYMLGFTPQKLDGKFHQLKVTLNRPEKLSVQAREGYYAAKNAPSQ